MIKVEDYISLSREVRRSHLNLNTSCIERGGGSKNFTGLLAAFLNTTIPVNTRKKEIQLCHACHNGKCSNPEHLYWGTPKDNSLDRYENNPAVLIEYICQNCGESFKRRKGRVPKFCSRQCLGQSCHKGKSLIHAVLA